MSIIVQLIRLKYELRLARQGIPADPAERTPEQQATATLEFWAVKNEVGLDALTLDQSAVEDK